MSEVIFYIFYYSSIAEIFFIVLYIICNAIILCLKINFHQMVFFEKRSRITENNFKL